MTMPEQEQESTQDDRESTARRFVWEPGDIEIVSPPGGTSEDVTVEEEEVVEGETETAEDRQRRIAEARARVEGLSANSDE